MSDQSTSALELCRAARALLVTAEVEAERQRAKLASLKMKAFQLQEERDALRAAEDRDEELRQLDGTEAVPVNEARRARLAELDKAAPAAAGAQQRQESRIADAEREVKEAKSALVGPVLLLVAEHQEAALDGARIVLRNLAPYLAQIAAADQIRHVLIGDRFAVPAGCPAPIGGIAVIRALLKALPDRLKPADLAEQLLLQAAHEQSSTTISKIKDSDNDDDS